MRKERMQITVEHQIPVDAVEFAAAAAEMRRQMDPARWAVVVLLAEAVVAEETQAELGPFRAAFPSA